MARQETTWFYEVIHYDDDKTGRRVFGPAKKQECEDWIKENSHEYSGLSLEMADL